MFTISIIFLSILFAMANKSSGRTRHFLLNNQGDFGSGGGKTKVNTVSDTYGGVREPYLQWLTGQVGQPGPVYQGQTTAPMSEQEQSSLGKVNQYAGAQNYGTTFAAGKKQIEDTLGGNYDPATSPYYQAVKAASAQNLADTQKNIASNAAGGGRFWSGARMKQQARASTDRANSLDTVLGQQAENERQRQVSLIPQAMAYGKEETNLPLQQAMALQSLGALPRNIEQNKLNAMLENFYKSQYDWPLNIAQIIAGVQAPPTQTMQAQNSGLQNATQGFTQAAMLGMLMCWVSAEVLANGNMSNRKVNNARFFIEHVGPKWFKNFYSKHGLTIAKYIKNKSLLKSMLRPFFEKISLIGHNAQAERMCYV